ncbi:mycothione reductase [Corynebacterium sp. TAE3-ERU12]|uniref:mycothione reductase n=1 Tax=Corynebacterium sp. TAE3-ERU12 TaxID=2849491 RepID=UPI001C477BB6|nr:mycothione reductase [Corynebacterium sp. TAE3-ERU12]MBV7295236.1 mycothione reductase [Corynebacterium sp. TAE3-ERU12]
MTATADKHYDVIIIGSGSGNSIPSPAYDDLSIALVEEGRFGGTCLNVGCIPTKMYVLAADAALNAREAGRLGVHASVDSVDWDSIRERVFAKRIDPIAEGGEAYRRGTETPNIDVYDQHARFVGERTIVTGQGDTQRTISADQVIIAAGSRTSVPQFVLDSGVDYRTNADVMRMDTLPKEMIILGAGYIACEFAHVFSALGVTVHVINRSGLMVRHCDGDVAQRFTDVVTNNWDVHLNTVIDELSADGDDIVATLSDGTTVRGQELLVATGRTPNGDLMDLDKGGVEMTDDGRVAVDAFGRTSADGVWALGDVSSAHQLKHVANFEATAVFQNVLACRDGGANAESRLRTQSKGVVPSAIFSHPQIGQVGMTEEQATEWAQANGKEITVKVQDYSDVAYGWALEDTHGFCKLIADKHTGRLLGAHFIGEQAATLVQQCVQMIAFNIDCREAASQQYWIHPALPELLENALLGLEFDEA